MTPGLIEDWGITGDGQKVRRVHLTGGDLSVCIITYGATIQDLRMVGHDHPLVLGLDSIADYEAHGQFFGAIAGRCANRISQGRFRLDGSDYQLEVENGHAHHLHGGPMGFFARHWSVDDATESSVTLSLESRDGDMGYPGNLRAICRYELTADNELVITLTGKADASTLCNLVSHAYFNLENGGASDVGLHRLRIDADRFLVVDKTNAPTGEQADVEATIHDFRKLRPIGDFTAHDHNFCLAAQRRPVTDVARLSAPSSGIEMDVLTSEPGLQLYAGAYLQKIDGLAGITYVPGSGVCLEAQVWPDAANHPSFPSAVLRPGEISRQETIYRFGKL